MMQLSPLAVPVLPASVAAGEASPVMMSVTEKAAPLPVTVMPAREFATVQSAAAT